MIWVVWARKAEPVYHEEEHVLFCSEKDALRMDDRFHHPGEGTAWNMIGRYSQEDVANRVVLRQLVAGALVRLVRVRCDEVLTARPIEDERITS